MMNLENIGHVATEITELGSVDEFKTSTTLRYHNKLDMRHIDRGSHVCYDSPNCTHHGIIIQKGDTHITLMRYINQSVIDKEDIFWNNDLNTFIVEENEIELQVAIYSGPTFSPLSVVNRAFARFKEEGYHPVTNNAEGFPRWCKTGNGGQGYCNTPRLHSEEPEPVQEFSEGDVMSHPLYTVPAIVLSADEHEIEVIYFHEELGNSAPRPRILKQGFQLFPGMRKVVYRPGAQSESELVRLRAEEIQKVQKEYDLLPSHCAHFATWCKTGIWQGEPVRPRNA